MPNSVDNRVVQLEFDNGSFEKGVATTLASLENIHKKLNSGISSKGLDELSSKIKGIKFDSVVGEMDKVSEKTHGLVSLLKDTITELGGLGKATALGAIGGVFGQIISGGSRRASNIEQAKFQLEGLKVAWDDVQESLNYAVKDTAYGLDEAAKAASQYVASGVQLGDQMNYSLRAISGVAAMTNSSFDDTARIFTTIAGNGRVMGDQLNQLGARGLNAAAILAESFGVSEAELREMVSRGEVSFDAFAKAMDNAFGEHAKEANKTFTGAVANMKAALSRIGADFIMPLHEAGRLLALGMTDVFNNIRAGLNNMVEYDFVGKLHTIGGAMEGYADKFSERGVKINSIVASFEEVSTHMASRLSADLEKIADSKVLMNFISSLTYPLDGLFHLVESIVVGVADIGTAIITNLSAEPFVSLLEPIGMLAYDLSNIIYPILESLVEPIGLITASISNIGRAIMSFLSPLVHGILDGLLGRADNFTEILDNISNAVTGVLKKFRNFTSGLILDKRAGESVYNVFMNIAKVFRTIGGTALSIVTGGFKAIIGVFQTIGPIFQGLGNVVSSIVEPVIRLAQEGFGKLAESLRDLLKMDSVTDKLNDIDLGNATSIVLGFVETVRSAFENDFVEKAADTLNGLADTIRTTFSDVTLDNFSEKLQDLRENSEEFAAICDGIAYIWDRISEAAHAAYEWIKSLIAGDISIDDTIFGKIGSFFGSLEFGSFNEVTEKLESFEGTIGGISNSFKDALFGDAFKSFGGNLDDTAKKLDTSKLATRSMADAMGSLKNSQEGFAKNLKLMDMDQFAAQFDNANQSVGNFVNGFTLGDLITRVSAIITGFMTGSLAKFLYNLSDLPKQANDFINKLKAPFTKATELLDHFVKRFKDSATAMTKAAKADMIRAIGEAILMMAAALFILAAIPEDKAIQGVELFGLLCVAVGAAMVGVGKLFASITTAAEKLNAVKLASSASSIAAFSIVMLSMGAAVLMLAASVAILSLLDTDKAWAATAQLGILILTFVALAAVVGHMKSAQTQILEMAILIGMVSASLLVLSGTLVLLSLIPWDMFLNGFEKLAIMLLMFLGAVSLFAVVLSAPEFKANLAEAAASILAIGLAMVPLTAAVVVLSFIPWEKAVVGLIAVAGLMVTMAAAVNIMARAMSPKMAAEMLAAGAAIMAMSVAVISFTAAVMMLSAIDGGKLEEAVTALAVGLTVMALIPAAVAAWTSAKDMLAVSAMMLVMSAAVLAISSALSVMALVPWQGLAAGVAAIAAVFLVLGVAAVVLSPLASSLLMLSAAVLLLGGGIAAIGAGMQLFAAGLLMLAAIGPATALQIGTAIMTITEAIGNSIVIMAEKLAEAIVIFGKTLADNAPQLKNDASKLAKNTISGLGEAIPQVVQTGIDLILGFLRGIASCAADIAKAGIDIVTNLIMGIAAAIGDLIEAGAMLVIMFITGIADTLRSTAGMLNDAVTSVIGTILSLVAGLIADGLESIFGPNPVADAIRGMSDGMAEEAEAASERVHGAFDEKFNAITGDAQEMMGNVTGTLNAGAPAMGDAGHSNGDAFISSLVGDVDAGLQAFDISAVSGSGFSVSTLSSYGDLTGTTLGESFREGTDDEMSKLPGEMKSRTQDAVDQASSVDSYSAGNTVGYNFGSGMHAGVDSWVSRVCDKAAQMVRDAKAAANAEQDSNSPAKDLIEIGGWFGEGYYLGIDKWIEPIVSKSSEMVDKAKRPVEEFATGFTSILDGIDFDADPVITPILDLNEVRSGLDTMQNLFPESQAMSASFLGQSMAGYPVAPVAAIGSRSTVMDNSMSIVFDNTTLNSSSMIQQVTRDYLVTLARLAEMNHG